MDKDLLNAIEDMMAISTTVVICHPDMKLKIEKKCSVDDNVKIIPYVHADIDKCYVITDKELKKCILRLGY